MEAIFLLITILLITLSVILLFNYFFYKYYVDPTDSYPLATFTVVIGMTVGLLCVLLIPIDIFLTTHNSQNIEKITEIIKIDRSYFQIIMYIVYGVSLLVSFVLVPFAYFYGDERIEDIRPQESEFKEKICNSLKNTVIFIMFCAFLLLCGLFFKQGESAIDLLKSNDKSKWIQNLFNTDHMGEQSISFTISIFSVFGIICLIVYTGYGLAALPFYLIKGNKSLSTAHEEFEMSKADVRERIRSLQEKMSRKGNLSNKEKKELNNLRQDEHSLDKKLSKLSGLLVSENIVDKILVVFTPFRVIIGIICLVISLLIFVALFITSLDRLLHSKCGLNCGYVLDDMNYTNYIDYLLLYSSKYLHLDYFLFASINIYVFICSIYGFIKLGIRICFFTWFEIRKRSTNPQGLLIMSFILCMMILAFIMEIFTLAPQYSTFGNQKFSKSSMYSDLPCSLSLLTNIKSECVMTNISKFNNRVSISLPFFSTIFYVANWLLIIIGTFSLIYAGFIKEDNDVFEDYNDDDEERHMLQ